METLIEAIKKNGKIELNVLSKKQLISLLDLWSTTYAKKENSSFTQMLSRCYKSSPWTINSPILYIHSDWKTVTTIYHAFYNLTDAEESIMTKALFT